MLDRVGDVHLLAVHAGFFQCAVEELPRPPDERMALEILLVPWLLADQHHLRVRVPFAENRLRRIGPQLAIAAHGGGFAKGLERPALRLPHGSNVAGEPVSARGARRFWQQLAVHPQSAGARRADAGLADPVPLPARKTRLHVLAFEVGRAALEARGVDALEGVHVDHRIEMVVDLARDERYAAALCADVELGWAG